MSNVLKMAAVGGAVSAETDANFKQTVLLLHGDGTNGAQNNTFLDGSTNNFTITRNGNTTQGTFSPFSLAAGEWSNYFDGTGDYLTAPSNSAFAFGTGAYTIEAWVYRTGVDTNESIVFSAASASNAINLNIATNGAVTLAKYGVGAVVSGNAGDISSNGWYHIAVVRTSTGSNDTKIYVNGVLTSTGTDSNDWTVSSSPIIGGFTTFSTYDFIGYISNLRVVKGTAITPPSGGPTAPLTAITNTSLLTCQSNRFVDNSTANSGTGFAITRNGDVRVTPFSPFAPSAAYSASTNGGSGYFDGTGDYLSIADAAALDLASGDFTIEAWIYLPVAPAADDRLFKKWASTSGYMLFFQNNTGTLRFIYRDALGGGPDFQGAGVVIGQWNHVAVTRSTNTYNIWVNGASVANTTNTASIVDNALNLNIGGDDVLFEGYMSQARILKGTALYTSAFTPPTAPFTAITNTSLLLNFTNAGIFDNTGKNVLETVGNAQIDTGTKKYGTGSMEFDGTTDYVVQPTSENYGYGTGDFTIEFWLYLNAVTGSKTIVSNLTSSSSTNPHLYMSTSSIRYYTVNADRITGGTLSTGQWYHIALVRASGSTRLYIDGTQSGSTYTDANNYGATAPLGIGTYWSSGSPVTTDTLNGFIDDLRITKGVARYPTEPFPTAAFPDK
jgi:hypothetical protein